jgi:hypothetical protein
VVQAGWWNFKAGVNIFLMRMNGIWVGLGFFIFWVDYGENCDF